MAVVGRTAEFAPGEVKSVEVNGEEVAVVNLDGQFYAFSDTCTHRGCSLAEGELTGSTIVCHCHGGQFDVTSGEVLGGPPQENLKTFEVTTEDGNLSVR